MRAGSSAVLCLALLGVGCARLLSPPPWEDYYDPRYPDHRIALELCEATSEDPDDFARCMQESVVGHPDHSTPLGHPRHRP